MDPELQAVVDLLPAQFADPAVSFADPVTLRAGLAAIAKGVAEAGLAPVPDARVSRRDLSVPGPEGAPPVPVRIYEPEGWTRGGPVVLHIHGGAFVIGSLDQDNVSCERLALGSGCPVVSVGYRLAPEHPFPAPADDSFAAFRWLADGKSELEIDPQRIVVTGVSAGGALAAAVALMARDFGTVQPIYQLLLFPVLDDRMNTPSMKALRDTPLWNGRSSILMWKHYLGADFEGEPSPYAAPARASDLSGLPAAAITTGEFDPLRDEAIEYASRLMEAGVPVELHVIPGVIHAFDGLVPDSKLATRVHESRFRALRTVLSRSPEQLAAMNAGGRWIDPEIEPVLPYLPTGQSDDVEAGRKLLEDMLGGGGIGEQPGEDKLIVSQRSIAGPDGAPDIPLRIYRPRQATGSLACVLDYHGGAFSFGSTKMDHPGNVRLASELGIVVVSVEYRLSPENPFPAGVDDCYAALLWVHAHADELGVDVSRVAVSGGSAGGALAAAVALMARDRSGPPICFQSLQIPVTDEHLDTWSMKEFIDSPMFNRPGAELMWERYLGQGYSLEGASPYAAPARANDVSGLPPAYVQTMALDPLRDEGIAYASRLMQAGVPVELHAFPGTFHGSGFAVSAAVSKRASQETVDVLGLALQPRT
ncbi:MAG: lipase/esterase [Mycobacterium sp.]|nr:lipase/esterase [Mycobacterium sp.]